MLDGLVFGWRSAFLLAVLLPVIALALALCGTLHNRLANRTLATLLAVLALYATPWMIGFAGFYDRWPVLTYVPFALNLAVPPLLWFYASALVEGHLPRRAWLHLLPAMMQAIYRIGRTALPPQPVVEFLFDIALATGALVYGLAALRILRRYRHALADLRSDDARFAAHWLSRAIVAVLALLTLTVGYKVAGQFVALGYEGNMGLYIAVALTALYLGIEGWRYAAVALPHAAATVTAEPEPPPPRDWQAFGENIAARIRREGWEADPGLSLDRLARLMGTNTSYVSRALNEGLGMNFSSFVNGLRSERVAAAIAAGSDAPLLRLAVDAGFASKATFNRAFRARFDVTPSDYRQRIKT